MDVSTAIRSEDGLRAYAAAWLDGVLPGAAFTHAGHVLVAAWFLTQLGFDGALQAMRMGIPRFNIAAGGRNTPDSGYHETATIFWVAKIAEFLRSREEAPALDQVCAAVEHFRVRRDWFGEHYSFDVIASLEARRRWIPPDRTPLPLAPAAEYPEVHQFPAALHALHGDAPRAGLRIDDGE
jgi:hypothetical protein